MATKKSTTSEKAERKEEVISDVLKVSEGHVLCYVVGTSPLIHNRMSEKAKHELLMPKGRKNAAERATSLKHIPVDEFRASPYILRDEKQPTLISILSTAFKGALRTAALDMPGMKKAQIGRLTYVEGEMINIYGIPKLFMSIVRSADMNKTPDVRTRAIMEEWCACVPITFVEPLVRAQAVVNLLAAAGITIGVGDGRPEKGAMNFGRFKIVDKNDPDFARIVRTGGRKAQVEALAHPTCHDDESTELLSWFEGERQQRQLKGVSAA